MHPCVFETRHRADSTLQQHRHEFAYATIVVRGSYTEVRDGLPHTHRPGSVVLHCAGEEHADYFTDHARCINVEFRERHEKTFAEDGITIRDAMLGASVREITRSFYAADAKTLAVATHRLKEALVAAPQTSAPLAPEWLRATVEQFAWSQSEPLRAAAQIAGVHQTHFSRAFLKHLGVTPSQYRLRERLRVASTLLLESTVALSRIALRCGFTDQSHFTRTFRDSTGMSPSKYRRVFAS